MDLIDRVLEFHKKWEDSGWSGMNYKAFEALARMFPAPCQELYPLLIDEKTGETKLYLVKRPEDDRHYSGMWHNPGSAHRSTDSLVFGSVQNERAFKTVPPKILENEMEKPTWVLTGREKALHRVLASKEVGVDDGEALGVVKKDIINAGDFDLEWTPRGPENGTLNVWLVSPDIAEGLGKSSPTETGWYDVCDLKKMSDEKMFLQHQVNRVAKALDYVRENINPKCPQMPTMKV
jgi:hypothetical protein